MDSQRISRILPVSFRRFARKSFEIIESEGARTFGHRALTSLQRRFPDREIRSLPIRHDEIADSTRLNLQTPESCVPRERSLRVGWVATPPSLGSGGHTTLFRMVEGVADAGHQCSILLYDRYSNDISQRASDFHRGWPSVSADVVDARKCMDAFDVLVASSWPTAHIVARYSTTPTRRAYFIQDFEPFFYARGSEYALAEDTYRFGFMNIALGKMVASCLWREVGVVSNVADFGCDSSVYFLTNSGARNGVVVYAKPGVARRGFLLADRALKEFHERHPEQEIHFYGSKVRNLDYPVTYHDRLSPVQLASLYNRCVAGIGMSFTNISLVVEEMLACGLIPIVNDSLYSRADISSGSIAWAAPTIGAIADELCRVVEGGDLAADAAIAAASVRAGGWRPAQSTVLSAIEKLAYGNP